MFKITCEEIWLNSYLWFSCKLFTKLIFLVRRLPPILWRKIRRELQDDFSEREADGSRVIVWAHKQVMFKDKRLNFSFSRNFGFYEWIMKNLEEKSFLLVSRRSNTKVSTRWVNQESPPYHHVRFLFGNMEQWKKEVIQVKRYNL